MQVCIFCFYLRLAKYQAFKNFNKRILVATDLFGRGMDIERVNIVVNYDMPEDSDSYLHRVSVNDVIGNISLCVTVGSTCGKVWYQRIGHHVCIRRE